MGDESNRNEAEIEKVQDNIKRNVSKGIDCYFYGSGADASCWMGNDYNSFGAGVHAGSMSDSGHVEVDAAHLPGSTYIGPFTVEASSVSFERTNQIDTSTGNLANGSQMTNISQLQSVISGSSVITFGFYDAGTGEAGLPSSDRCWLTSTPEQSKWMGAIASPGSAEANVPFTTFVLPSAHDAGMNTTANVMEILRNMLDHTSVMRSLIAAFPVVGAIVEKLFAVNAENIIAALSITQKDTLTTMLRTGARYFEFRPAYLSTYFAGQTALPDGLYYTHLVIPGQSFDSWLAEAVQFLLANPTEIIVVQTRNDGVHESCKMATDAEVDSHVNSALAGTNIQRGHLPDMKRSIDDLRKNKVQLIVLSQVNQFSTYDYGGDGKGNDTLSGTTIVEEFQRGLADAKTKEPGNDIVTWQCQATATSIPDVVLYSVMNARGLTSPLLCTKPVCDQLTLPWLAKNLYPTMPTDLLQIIMNDWFDGWTASVAIELSQKFIQKAAHA